jgi:putative nucleotidyltransferase with HDIG domain
MYCNDIYSGDNKRTGFRIVIVDITERKQAEYKIEESYKRLQKSLNDTINTLASITENRDPYTSGHQKKVAYLAINISEELGLSSEETEALGTAAMIHDIGKIAIPASILSRPGKITDVEFEMIKTHPRTGYDIIKNIKFPYPIDEIILQHHERLDGSGYPRGLKGKDIMLEAKILAVADVVEAMSSHRPYRPALGIDKALEEIDKNKGILYDPDVVRACKNLFIKKKFKF